ncbi:hypothetical protein [Billgrantia diversa]|nr:hypothetical protein [Halomonas sp. MCCC 1A13316]
MKRYEVHGNVPASVPVSPLRAIPLVDLDCQVWGVVRSVIPEYTV